MLIILLMIGILAALLAGEKFTNFLQMKYPIENLQNLKEDSGACSNNEFEDFRIRFEIIKITYFSIFALQYG